MLTYMLQILIPIASFVSIINVQVSLFYFKTPLNQYFLNFSFGIQ
jgi:hypothetical protein